MRRESVRLLTDRYAAASRGDSARGSTAGMMGTMVLGAHRCLGVKRPDPAVVLLSRVRQSQAVPLNVPHVISAAAWRSLDGRNLPRPARGSKANVGHGKTAKMYVTKYVTIGKTQGNQGSMPMNKPHLEFQRVDMTEGWVTP